MYAIVTISKVRFIQCYNKCCTNWTKFRGRLHSMYCSISNIKADRKERMYVTWGFQGGEEQRERNVSLHLLLRLYSVSGRWMKYEHGALVEWYWQGKMKYLKKTCPSITLSTTNPTQTSLWSNPGLHDKRHATVVKIHIVVFWVITCYPLLGGYQSFGGTNDLTMRGVYPLLAAMRQNLISGKMFLCCCKLMM
jgi:hypothetical protein